MISQSKLVAGALATVLNVGGVVADAHAQALDPLSHDAEGQFKEFIFSASSALSVSLGVQETITGNLFVIVDPRAGADHAVEVSAVSSGSAVLR